MAVVLSELSCFGEVEAGMVIKDGDVGRRSAIPWSNRIAPFREADIRKPHLVEKVLSAAIQPLRRNQGAALERHDSCRFSFISSDVIDYFVHDFLGKFGSHDDGGRDGEYDPAWLRCNFVRRLDGYPSRCSQAVRHARLP